MVEEVGDVFTGNGLGEDKSLRHREPERSDAFQLRRCFDAFGDRRETQARAHDREGPQHGEPLDIFVADDERAVNLQRRDREQVHVTQR